MSILYFIIPVAFILALLFLAAFFWATNHGQYDDLESPAYKMLMDDYKKEGRNESKQ